MLRVALIKVHLRRAFWRVTLATPLGRAAARPRQMHPVNRHSESGQPKPFGRESDESANAAPGP